MATHGQAPCGVGHPRPGPYRSDRPQLGPLQGRSAAARAATHRQPAKGNHQQAQPPMARAAANRHSRPHAWLALAGAVPAGVGSTRKGSAHGSAPFGNSASPQGRRLRAQCPQELSP
ncbi:hypothetical protein GW17_00042623 [Ensete ventricosum]|nr:hypothetical protein GW17_00042623 [Ensete ventricosum]